MKKLSLGQLVADVMNLNTIIRFINKDNCYEQIVKFFTLTSELQDHSEELGEFLPCVEGFKFCGWKSEKRKKSEAFRQEAEMGLRVFLDEINKAGRDQYGHNRTEFRQTVTTYNVFFGDICGISTCSTRTCEDDCQDDAFVQERIRDQICNFVKSYQGGFNLDWLRCSRKHAN